MRTTATIFISAFVVALADSAVAQEKENKKESANQTAAAAVVVRGQQRWENAIRFVCLQATSSAAFERQVKQQAFLAGQEGYELVSASPGRFGTQDCIALAYRRPFSQ